MKVLLKSNIIFKIVNKHWLNYKSCKACKNDKKNHKSITYESRHDIFQDTLDFMSLHQIIMESDVSPDPFDNINPLDQIESFLKKLSMFENEYRIREDKLKVYRLTFLVAVILVQGRKAIDLIKDVNVQNKRIAYYESNRNGSIDKLIQHWKNILEGENENKLSHPLARREFEGKIMFAEMKKVFSGHFSFLLLNLIEHRDYVFFQKMLDQGDARAVVENTMAFFEVGHATNDMIYKSIAIQIFELFKELIPKAELKEIINRLIYFSFGKDYKNFSDFGKKGSYLKNIVNEFAIFDFDDDIGLRRRRRTGKVFAKLIQSSFQTPLMMLHEGMLEDTLKFRLSRLDMKYFGFLPKNFSSYSQR